jgi:hypothetical protein
MLAIFQAAPLSPIPRTYRAALTDPNWRAAMEAEYSALLANSTWDLLPRPPHTNVVTSKWVFKHKFKADGSLNATRPDGFSADLLSAPASTSLKHSVQS